MTEISENNSKFWNDKCGWTTAQKMGIKDYSKSEIKRFDHYYFKFYPYLKKYLPFNTLKNRDVAEFGLGYGTLSQYLAEHSKSYTGVDIAEGPVAMVNLRISYENLAQKAKALQASALDMPFSDDSLDYVIAIGCFHHTGNFSKCIGETHRVLRPGGQALVMVYSQYSLRRWVRWPQQLFLKLIFSENIFVTDAQKVLYDVNNLGEAAPETAFFSKREIKMICSNFKRVDVDPQNFDSHPLDIFRNFFLFTIGRLMGLDLYIKLTK